jgi:hypothetical protein
MKIFSTATLIATLFTFVAADGNVSKMELHQRALKAFSARKSNSFSRQLEVSAECMSMMMVLVVVLVLVEVEVEVDWGLKKCSF